MKLENLVGKSLCDAVVEVREDSAAYEEIVFLSKDIPAWNKAISEKLGPALISTNEDEVLKASEDVLASQIDIAVELAKSYGGIHQGQTLYHSVYESTVFLILIWPWQDNVKVTLKKAIL
ncbi:MAG: hypothetical protein QNK31_12465 [Porticoccus sp.]|nr:hypothetical protein [Porticoccus sp.]